MFHKFCVFLCRYLIFVGVAPNNCHGFWEHATCPNAAPTRASFVWVHLYCAKYTAKTVHRCLRQFARLQLQSACPLILLFTPVSGCHRVNKEKSVGKGASVSISHSSYTETEIHCHWQFKHQLRGGLGEKQKKGKTPLNERSARLPCKMTASTFSCPSMTNRSFQCTRRNQTPRMTRALQTGGPRLKRQERFLNFLVAGVRMQRLKTNLTSHTIHPEALSHYSNRPVSGCRS